MGEEDFVREQREEKRMMKVYSTVGTYDGEAFTSVHMTRKGALICAIEDIYEYLIGAPPQQGSLSTYVDDSGERCFVGSTEELKAKSSDDLYSIFRSWCDVLWDQSHAEYRIAVVQTLLQG
jgi:hypothetical protein